MTKHVFLAVATSCFASTTLVWAHSGGRDRYGCHHDRRAGVYHCHKGTFAGRRFSSKDEMLKLLACYAPAGPANRVSPPAPGAITVTAARIGCLDIQKEPNLTALVSQACDNQASCAYKAPTEDEYEAAGVTANTRTACTQAMEITYRCGPSEYHSVTVPGDAWEHPPAQLTCNSRTIPVFPPGMGAITVTTARIGCLDLQLTGNLTALVGEACNDRACCGYKAPTEAEYKSAGVTAETRPLCSQAMEITYRCGPNDDQVVTVPGDAWKHPRAELTCDGTSVARNRQDATPTTRGEGSEPACKEWTLGPPDYYLAPKDMLDWTFVYPYTPAYLRLLGYDILGFIPPLPPTPDRYNSPATSNIMGAPGSTLGANEGRLRAELRGIAQMKNPVQALCQAAQRFTRNGAASADTPSDQEFGTAFADLSVTGKAAFAQFTVLHPNEASLAADAACAGASSASLTMALDRAYSVANALRGRHDFAERQALDWIAVSGEDDQPYRPVNVPSNEFPQFQLKVDVTDSRFAVPVNTRYMIAHARPPAFQTPATPLVDGGPGRRVPADPLPALAADAQVILFIHGMDSRVEEATDLARALHGLGGKNWTVISMDLPTSGYADNLDHGRISPIGDVQCHNTPVVDYIEEFIVAFVDTLDAQLLGQLKPKIKAVVGGSLGGSMAMRLGRRPMTPWITHVVPWSPASIWPSMIGQHNAVAAGCDAGWNVLNDRAVSRALKWGGLEPMFAAANEGPGLRRELFYGGFDYSPVYGLGGPPQAECWASDTLLCKPTNVRAARLDRQETYDANFRAWHWRLGGEQLAFSHQLFTSPGTGTPLYLQNTKRTLLFSGYHDTCGKLEEHTRDVAAKMANTPGYARHLKLTGHSVDNEYPDWIARQIVDFLR